MTELKPKHRTIGLQLGQMNIKIESANEEDNFDKLLEVFDRLMKEVEK
jgi:hypothetical protein